MTRKDYVSVARAIKTVREASHASCPDEKEHNAKTSAITELEIALAQVFKDDNARFDRERFIKACEA